MDLIIVESPTKARTLSSFLGKGYEIEATMGHIKDLPKSKLGVDVDDNFKPDYIEVPKKKEVIEKLKKQAKGKKVIYIATDPDREGEAIAEHVAEILGQKNPKRITFHEITDTAVKEALENPHGVDENLVNAQTARRVLDRLVGYKLSYITWLKIRRGLSAGRVQSVALRLIVEKEREIEKFKAEEYWEFFCDFKTKDTPVVDFNAKLIKIEGNKADIKNKKEADDVLADLKKSKYTVSDVVKKQINRSPYPPLTTSTMTQSAARVYGWSAKKTMSVAQKLYEKGKITYHRTDSLNLSNSAVKKVRGLIEKQFGKNYLPEKPRFYKTKSKVAQEAHEAIRPTNVSFEFKKESKAPKEQQILYGLIRRRFIACQMKESVYDETTIEVLGKNSKEFLLRTRGRIMKFDGWKRIMKSHKEEEENIIPNVNKDAVLNLVKPNAVQNFTQPPSRYNEAMLIRTLESLGIGRPSTYAPIVTTIQIRNYVEKKEGRFFPTSIGIAVNDFLIANFPDIMDYKFTASMEDSLDDIANAKLKWVPVISDFWKPFSKKLKDVEKNAKRVKIQVEKVGRKCPKCKTGDLVIRVGRFGKFISCSNFPECDYREKYLEKVGMKCPECKKGDVIVKRSGKGRRFFGCSRYPECKWASWRKPQIDETRADAKTK